MTCYYADPIYQIGYREDATMLARGGPAPKGSPIPMSVGDRRMVKPESVTAPSKYGVPYSARYLGGCSWSSQEMFSHVKTRGWHGVEVI